MARADVRSPIKRRIPALLIVAILVVLPAALASAQSEAAAQVAAPTVELAVIGGVPNGPGISVPIEVTIVSPRAARGAVQLRLLDRHTNITVTVPVDLPANTPVRLPLSVPSSYNGVNVEATITLDGLAEVTETLQRWGGEMTATVGLIGVESTGETVGLGIDGGRAVVRELDDASVRSAGLGQIGTLVVSPAGLRGLSTESRHLVLGWLGGGGDALVVGAPGSIDDLLPAEWKGPTRPGVGHLRYVGPDWEAVLLPSAGTTTMNEYGPMLVFGHAGSDLNLNGLAELAIDAGLGLLGALTLLVFLGLYALLAGPITYLLLKRIGRLNLAWTALPALAVVFTVAAVAVGAGIRGDRNDSHATIVEVQPTGSTARSSLLLTSSFRGDRTAELPAGWQMTSTGDLLGDGSSAPISLQPDRDRTTVTMELAAGGAGVATFEGSAPMFDDALRITDVYVDDNGVVSGRVTNNAAVTLSDAVAFAGGGVVEIGMIEPSQTAEFSVQFAAPFLSGDRLETEFSIWPAPRWGDEPVAGETVGSSTWGQWRMIEGPNVFAPGLVGVVGWSREFDSPAADIGTGRTALVARVAIPRGSSAVSGADIDHVIMSTPSHMVVEAANFFGASILNRVDAPPAGGDIVAQIGDGVAGLEVWSDGWKWIKLDDDGDAMVILPPEAFVDGTAWLRTSSPEWAWPPSPGLSIVPLSTAMARGENPTNAKLRTGTVEYRTVGEELGRHFGEGPMMVPTAITGDVREIDEFVTVVVAPGSSETLTGELRGAEIDTYLIELEEGETIGVQLRSRVHDSYLVIRDESGQLLAENDDAGRAGSGVDSAIIFEAEHTGFYLIDASELGQSGNGGYELVVERGS